MAIPTGFEFDPHNTQPIRKADVLSPKEGMSLLDQFERTQKTRGMRNLPLWKEEFDIADKHGWNWDTLRRAEDIRWDTGNHLWIDEFGIRQRQFGIDETLPKLDRRGVLIPEKRRPPPQFFPPRPKGPREWKSDPGYF